MVALLAAAVAEAAALVSDVEALLAELLAAVDLSLAVVAEAAALVAAVLACDSTLLAPVLISASLSAISLAGERTWPPSVVTTLLALPWAQLCTRLLSVSSWLTEVSRRVLSDMVRSFRSTG